MSYAELQVTTHYSFLRGASSPEELFAAAAALGITALGIVDRNSLAGIVRAHEAAKATGVRLIVGCRLDLQCGTSLLVYPTDRLAYARLCRLLTLGKTRAGKGQCHLDWPDVEGIFAKLEEETEELRQAIGDHPPSPPPGVQDAIVSEVGDMLFTMVNLARRLNVEPELALRHTNAKFRRRFAAMEAASPQPLEALSAAQLESLWSQAKAEESPAAYL